MTLPTFLVDASDLDDSAGGPAGSPADMSTGVVTVAGDEGRHAATVRRIRAGERVQLTDGRGRVATGMTTEVGKHTIRVRVDEVVSYPRPTPSLTVVQAIPKGDRGPLAVEVLTEIGVDRIVPWAASRSVGVWRGERAAKSAAKWRAAARAAAKQARRAWLPEVTEQAGTAEVVELISGAAVALVLHEDAEASLAAIEVPLAGEVVVVVGPEGGISAEELAQLGGTAVRLGTEVLRTSTAGVAACAAVLSRTPRWLAT